MRKNRGDPVSPSGSTGTDQRRVAVGVVVFWACAFVVALPFALQLPGQTREVSFEAPPGSPSQLAEEALERHFPGRSGTGAVPVIVMIRSVAEKARGGEEPTWPSVLTKGVAKFSRDVRGLVSSGKWANYSIQASGFYLGIPWLGVGPRNYYIRTLFVGGRNTSSTLIFITPSEVTADVNISQAVADEFIASLRVLCASKAPPGTEVWLTGVLVMSSEIQLSGKDLQAGLVRMEAFAVPVGALIFWTLVSDTRMMLLPPLTLLVSLVVSFALTLPMARAVDVSNNALPTMVASIMAFSLDYSLLLLMRFSEGGSRGADPHKRVRVLLFRTGHTILLSGTLVIIASLGAWLLPARNVGIGSTAVAISVAVCMMVHLTLAPALMLLGSLLLSEDSSEGGLCGLAQLRAAIQKGLHERSWLRLMSVIQRCPTGIVFALTALCLPLAQMVKDMRVVSDSYMFLPQDIPSMAAMRLLEEDFIGGFAEPYMLILRAPRGQLLESSGYSSFLALHHALEDVKAVEYVISPFQWMNYSITHDNVTMLRRSFNPVYWKVKKCYSNLLSVTTRGDAALALLYTDFLPRGHLATEWVMNVRKILRAWEREHRGFSAWLTGGACRVTDMQRAMMATMPRYLACIVLAVGLVVLLAFRSILLPIRLAFALVLSITVAFSINMLIYQTSLLHPLLPSLRLYSGIEGSVVPVCIGVAVALGLDYDIFLVSRIVEYRRRGLSDPDSITRGVLRTGSTISGAGAIMALSFSGLYTTRKAVLHQYASVLVVSVLLDAFVVRTVLVPALMLSARGWNWWPRKMPEPSPTSDCRFDSDSGEENGGERSPFSKPGVPSSCSAAIIGLPVEAEEDVEDLH